MEESCDYFPVFSSMLKLGCNEVELVDDVHLFVLHQSLFFWDFGAQSESLQLV